MDGHALLGAYAVDAVDDRERRAFERHLGACDACWDEVASLVTVSRGLERIRPPAS